MILLLQTGAHAANVRLTQAQAANDLSTVAGCKRILHAAGEECDGDDYDELLLSAAGTIKRQRQHGTRRVARKAATEQKVERAVPVCEFIRVSNAIEAGQESNKTLDVKAVLSLLPSKLLVKRCGRGGGKMFGCKKQMNSDYCNTCMSSTTFESYYEWLFEFTVQDWDNEAVTSDILAVVKGGARIQPTPPYCHTDIHTGGSRHAASATRIPRIQRSCARAKRVPEFTPKPPPPALCLPDPCLTVCFCSQEMRFLA